jgi:hypothetical protein
MRQVTNVASTSGNVFATADTNNTDGEEIFRAIG